VAMLLLKKYFWLVSGAREVEVVCLILSLLIQASFLSDVWPYCCSKSIFWLW
jgi:hypothetical protein